jgi:DNA-binding SARP family transcriptional activator
MGTTRSSLRPPSAGGPPPAPCRVRLRLLDAFEVVCDGEVVELPFASQRLVAFVALHARPVLREHVAGTLWLDTTEARAAGNLRSTLWRVQKRAAHLLAVDARTIQLDHAVDVDVRAIDALAHGDEPPDARAFAGELLPGWYDDWVLLERERFRQLSLRALDTVCERHLRAGAIGEALEAGLLAVSLEPLRESAHRAIIRVHLADGNVGEALRQYRLCTRLLREQLGIGPTPQLRDLLGRLDAKETTW